ncbi:hypothetical protein VTK73DRAFT_5965 [Phialemonium thermophilum]|uniref:DUF6314 domain-containing protein n=1 Tax=Phialemonium thermophilum TaxID=223376 RepID=A0ABR3WKW2_9PEZI
MAKTVAIVGAGPSGLVAAKTLLHDAPPEQHFRVTIFEARNRVGGLWPASKEDDDNGGGMVHPMMVANQSRHTVQFSDFAWDPRSPQFPRAWQVGRYLHRYLDRYCGDAELRLGARVESARLSDPAAAVDGEHGAAAAWDLVVRLADGKVEERRFDHLLVASGFFGRPFVPSFPSTDPTLPVVHSSQYRSLEGLLGKDGGRGGKILVVGGQMSGVEIAGTIASHLSSATHSPGPSPIRNPEKYAIHHVVPRPAWVFPLYTSPKPESVAPPFVPFDLASYNLSNRPSPLLNTQGHISVEAAQIAHGNYGRVLGTDQAEFSPHLTLRHREFDPPLIAVSDTYMEFVRDGLIEVSLGKLESINGRTATVAPPAKAVDNIAAVVYATGFDSSSSLSFLPESVRRTLRIIPEDRDNTVALAFHGTHHPSIPNLGFVGFYRAPFWGVMEMQARFLTALWSAGGPFSSSLPATMRSALEADRSIERTLALRTDPRASQFPMGDYPFLMQDFASALGIPLRDPFGVTPRLPPSGKPMNILTPPRYHPPTPRNQHQQQEVDEEAEVQSSLRQTHETAMAGLTQARFVARAVFRSLLGTWHLERDLVSRLPSHPSGRFVGTARFLLREGTRDGGHAKAEDDDGSPSPPLEYLYVEEGDFRADNGLTFRATRRYVWRYDEARDKLSVWFTRPDDGRRVDYLFHEVDFIVPATEEDEEEKGEGWEAKAGHLCVEDFYDVHYRFRFRAVHLVDWRLQYTVRGPKKDYTIDGVYRRRTS